VFALQVRVTGFGVSLAIVITRNTKNGIPEATIRFSKFSKEVPQKILRIFQGSLAQDN
jgi:hypothetical protein